MRLRTWFYPLSLALMALVPGDAATGPWAQYAIIDDITALADDGTNLWLGTTGGLARLGKASAETTWFNQANSSLTDVRVRCLASDGKGRMAVVTRGGCLAEFDGAAWSAPGASAAFRGQTPIDLAWAAGSLWVLAVDRQTRLPSLFRRQNGLWTRIYLEGSDPMYSDPRLGYGYSPYLPSAARSPWLQADGQGRIWVSLQRGPTRKVYRLDTEGKLDSIPVPPANLYPLQLVVTDSGTVNWICARFLARPVPGGWDTTRLPGYPFPYGFLGAHPRNLHARDADGADLWTMGDARLYRSTAAGWDSLSPPGFRAGHPVLILESPGGGAPPKVYAASRTRFGALSGTDWNWADIGSSPFRPGYNPVLCARGAGLGGIWLGGSHGMDEFVPASGSFKPADLGPDWGTLGVTSLASDRKGRAWIANGAAPGLLVAGGGGSPRLLAGGPSPRFAASTRGSSSFMAEDSAGTLWFADSARLLSSRDGSEDTRAWQSHRLPVARNQDAQVLTVRAHRDGSIWVAAISAARSSTPWLARYSGSAWRVFDSLPTAYFNLSLYRDLRCDVEGNVWIRYNDGLLRWDGTLWTAYPWTANPLFGKGLAAMALDGNGTLWAATAAPEAGLLRWNQGWRAVPEASGRMATFPVREMAFDGAGKLWMTSDQNGVLVYDPAIPTATARAPFPGAAGGKPILSRRQDGSWRLYPGPAGLREPVTVRILDPRGRAVAGSPAPLKPSPEGDWVWTGPDRSLAPGRYLVSIRAGGAADYLAPFLHPGP